MNDCCKIWRNPIWAVIVFFVFLFVYSKFGPNIPISILSQQKGEPLIVTETGNATAVPDIANIMVGIEESGGSISTVQNSVNQKSKSLVEAFKKLGIAESDIKTQSYNVYPEYDYRVSPQKVNGYRISTTYLVKIKDFDKINEAIVIATNTGANVIGNVSFEVNDETKNKVLTQAREEAVTKAKEKAQSLAKAAGVTLGKIINITEDSSPIRPYPLTADKAFGLGGAETIVETPEIIPGETEFTVTVSVSWEIR
ncbi:MAG: hypothetical protein A2V72_02670 [Candidatus Nealsonbacteria bacterium RBG_13_37_56]|uniref:SIMPL domain-containing protein n=1 Tax=Candidatus Nealsonbacteria bacterium RBG_13_37_56 TaxID=1801661 RepID=A0A1G2DYU6_9BACT|nr:MAG: hypothetical protein A2V72_02670 [Candidatus Nealsonbacteria bacterium RBG_13_37_56]